MSNFEQQKDPLQPLDKASNTHDLLEILKFEHDKLDERKEQLIGAMTGILKFYDKVDEAVQKKDGVIWQYSMSGQIEFQKDVFELDLASSAVYKVVVENSVKLYTLKTPDERMELGQANGQSIVVNPPEKREISLLPRFGQPKKEPSLNEYQKPYLRSEDMFSETKQISKIYERWNDKHARLMISAYKLKNDFESQNRAKRIEFNFYWAHVRPLLTKLIGARSDIVMDKEQDLVSEALSNVYRGIERNRNNPMEQMNAQKG